MPIFLLYQLLSVTNKKQANLNVRSCKKKKQLRIQYRGVESSTISSINFSILGSNNRFSTNYMTALGLNQAYTSLKLCNKYNKVLICSFRSITGNMYITAINKKLIGFFFSSITQMIFY